MRVRTNHKPIASGICSGVEVSYYARQGKSINQSDAVAKQTIQTFLLCCAWELSVVLGKCKGIKTEAPELGYHRHSTKTR